MEPHKCLRLPGLSLLLFSKKSYSSCTFRKLRRSFFLLNTYVLLAVLAQTVACLPLVQHVPGGVVNFHSKNFNLGARRGGDVHFLIARLYTTGLD